MRILALDQASNISGWAIFQDDYLEQHGKIDVSKYADIGERLHLIRQEVEHLIDDEHIDVVLLEDIYMDGQRVNNVQTFKILAEVFGVLYELCVEMEIPVYAILAGTWKSTLGIKGKTRAEQKRAAAEYVQNKYNLKVIQDIADAICIGSHYIQSLGNNWEDE